MQHYRGIIEISGDKIMTIGKQFTTTENVSIKNNTKKSITKHLCAIL